MSLHNFIESNKHSSGHPVIYCGWCGVVVWSFGFTDYSVETLQKNVGQPCVHKTANRVATPTPRGLEGE